MQVAGFIGDPRFDRSRQRRSEKKQGKKHWNWLSCWALERDMNFRMRFVSHPTLMPQGLHPYTVHKLHQHPGDESPMKILCTESYATVRTDTNPTTGLVEIVKKDCFICDVMAEIEEHMDGQTLDHIVKTDASLYEAVEAMSPFQCRTYLMPALICAREVKISEDESEWHPDNSQVQSIILAVREFDGQTETCPGGMMARLLEFQRPLPYLDNPQYGNWFYLTNVSQGGGYMFSGVEQASDLFQTIPNFSEMFEKYPDCKKYGQTQTKYKKSIAHSYDYAKFAWMRSWHGIVMQQRYGIDVSQFNGGI